MSRHRDVVGGQSCNSSLDVTLSPEALSLHLPPGSSVSPLVSDAVGLLESGESTAPREGVLKEFTRGLACGSLGDLPRGNVVEVGAPLLSGMALGALMEDASSAPTSFSLDLCHPKSVTLDSIWEAITKFSKVVVQQLTLTSMRVACLEECMAKIDTVTAETQGKMEIIDQRLNRF